MRLVFVWFGRLSVAVAFMGVLLSASSASAMTTYVIGRQNAVTHSGVGGNVWAYTWLCQSQGAQHVSSFYVNKDGYSATVNPDDYIEAGIYADSFTMLAGDTRPVAFYAYEDSTYTSGQVKKDFNRVSLNAWHSVKIANYYPYYGNGGTDWCVYIDGVIKKDGLTDRKPSFYQGQAMTSSERGLPVDSNLSSFDNVYNRFPNNTTGLWTSIKFEDRDYGYVPFQVDGSAWRCIVGN